LLPEWFLQVPHSGSRGAATSDPFSHHHRLFHGLSR
jgi:hypothetical protein